MRKRKAPTKKPKKRMGHVERPWNDGEWTTARFRSFIMSALRGARWPARHNAVRKAFVTEGLNPKTGRKCKLHKCEHCKNLFPQGEMHADHKEPVIPLEANWSSVSATTFLGYDWNTVIARLYVEMSEYTILCHGCHAQVTHQEKTIRKALTVDNQPEDDE